MTRYSQHSLDDEVSGVVIVPVLVFRFLGPETITPQRLKRKQGSRGGPQGRLLVAGRPAVSQPLHYVSHRRARRLTEHHLAQVTTLQGVKMRSVLQNLSRNTSSSSAQLRAGQAEWLSLIHI